MDGRYRSRALAVCVWGGGKGAVPNLDANYGEFHRVPCLVLLSDVQSHTNSPGGSAAAAGWDLGRRFPQAAVGDL